MENTKENAPAATRAAYITNFNQNYKRFPAYGKQLMTMRLAGRMPAGRVIVTFDWSLGRAFHRIVVPEGQSLAELNFVFLAGLSVEVVYHYAKHARLIDGLVEAILKVNPSCLITFALDLVDIGDAVSVIKPYQLEQIAEAA